MIEAKISRIRALRPDSEILMCLGVMGWLVEVDSSCTGVSIIDAGGLYSGRGKTLERALDVCIDRINRGITR